MLWELLSKNGFQETTKLFKKLAILNFMVEETKWEEQGYKLWNHEMGRPKVNESGNMRKKSLE